MKELEISDNFTIEDIHKIREYNLEKRKKMSEKERLEYIKKSADECEEDIKEYKKNGVAI